MMQAAQPGWRLKASTRLNVLATSRIRWAFQQEDCGSLDLPFRYNGQAIR